MNAFIALKLIMRRRMRNKGIEFKENKNNESEYRVVVELSNGKKFGELAF